jgi:hypothetical protein
VDKGDVKRAAEALDFSLTKMPNEVAYDPSLPDTVDLLFKVGQHERAVELSRAAWHTSFETAAYIVAEEERITFELRKSLFVMDSLQRNLALHEEQEMAADLTERYDELMAKLEEGMASGRIAM